MQSLRVLTNQVNKVLRRKEEKQYPGGYAPVLDLLSGITGWTVSKKDGGFICMIGPTQGTSKFLEQAILMAFLKVQESKTE